MNDQIEWRDIEGYEGRYQISNAGQVKRLERFRPSKIRHSASTLLREKVLSLSSNPQGYNIVALWDGHGYKQPKVARLVAKAFIPNPTNKPTVNHIDGNKLNDRVGNLEWNTYHENAMHKCRVLYRMSGLDHYRCTMTREQILQILKLQDEGLRPVQVSRLLKIGWRKISLVMRRKTFRQITAGYDAIRIHHDNQHRSLKFG